MSRNDEPPMEYPQRHRLRLACLSLCHAFELVMSFSACRTLAEFVLPLTQLPEDKLKQELEGDPMLESLVEGLSRIDRGDPPVA